MHKIKKELVAVCIVIGVISFQLIRSSVADYFEINKKSSGITEKVDTNVATFHNEEEIKSLRSFDPHPIQPGETFLHSNNCRGCHGPDSAAYANVDYDGVDINLHDDWRATMMANSSRDPLWRAKVSHEIMVNPGHANELQNKCTSCHAPMGHYSSKFKGFPFYTLSALYNDSLGLDGVSCLGCHMIGPEGLGALFSGEIPYDTNHVAYGPFESPNIGPMQLYVGFTPMFSEHVSQGKMCSSCHTLLTSSVDLAGTPTGRQFVEQATYHEWVNSTYSSDLVSCQSCHMPQLEDSIVIANGYFNMPPRKPFNQHQFMGSNLFMLRLMKNNKERLGVEASNANYDSTISATIHLLQNKTMGVNILVDSVNSDTAFFTVKLSNRAGHKFPSGYPSRRAVLQFVVVGAGNDTLFKSGLFDPNYEVVNIDPTFEPHYNVISNESQSQIYEMVMADVNGNKTSVLERADSLLKDNRIPPEGFVTSHAVYDTVKIMGEALLDEDFNKAGASEGTGKDLVHYHVPINGYAQPFNVYAHIYYQAVPPGFLNEMFSYTSAEIDTFRVMYNAADRSPVWVAGDSLSNIALGITVPDWDALIKIGPSPTSDGNLNIFLPETSDDLQVRVFDMTGKLSKEYRFGDKLLQYNIQLPGPKGSYVIELVYRNKPYIRKVMRN